MELQRVRVWIFMLHREKYLCAILLDSLHLFTMRVALDSLKEGVLLTGKTVKGQ